MRFWRVPDQEPGRLARLLHQADRVPVEDARRWHAGQPRRDGCREPKVEHDDVWPGFGHNLLFGGDVPGKVFRRQPAEAPVGAKDRSWHLRHGARFETRALSRDDTEKYIRHRLAVAGGAQKIKFGPGAFNAIHRHSGGYPRLINLICDRALREAYRRTVFTITKPMVRKAAANLTRKGDLHPGAGRRRIRIAAAVIFILIAAASALLLFNGRTPTSSKGSAMTSGKGMQETASIPDSTVPVVPPEVPHQSPALPTAVETPPPAPAPLKMQGPTEYFLQVYSFRAGETAEEAARQLRGLNLPAFVIHHAVGGEDGWFGVYAGPFADPEAARRADSDIRAATGVSPVMRERVARKTTPKMPPGPDNRRCESAGKRGQRGRVLKG